MAGRFLMWILAAFVSTLLFLTFFSLKMALILFLVLLGFVLIAAFIRFPMKPTLIACLIAGMLGCAIFSFAQGAALKIEQKLLNQERRIGGIVVESGSNSAKTLKRLKVRLKNIDGEPVRSFYPYYVYLYTDSDQNIDDGTVIDGVISFFDSPIDFKSGRSDAVLISGYQQMEELSFHRPNGFNWRGKYAQFRHRVQERICFGREETIGFLKSVCFGNKESLPPNLEVSLRRIGLTHVTAVSGLHLTFAVLLFNALCIAVGIPYRTRYLLGIFIALFFTATVGFPPSCVRACIMWIIVALGMAMDVIPDGLTSLAVAAFLITIFQPFGVRDIGFLLSVFATVGLVTLRMPIENFLFPKKLKEKSPFVNGIFRSFTGIIGGSVGVTLTTLPIMLSSFGAVSLIAPLANVLLIYPIQLFFMLGLAMVLLGFLPGVGVVIGWVCDVLYSVIFGVSKSLAQISFANVSSIGIHGVVFLFIFLCLIGIGLYHFLRFERRSFMVLFTAFLCFVGIYSAILERVELEEKVEIAFIDVGQGDCTVISKGNSAAIIDYGGSSLKRYNLIRYLKEKDIYNIELMAFTHLHDDHTNGLFTLMDNVYFERVLYPNANYDSESIYTGILSLEAEEISNGNKIEVLDGVVVTPIVDAFFDPRLEKDNERCVCYRIEYDEVSILVTGDIEQKAEMELLQKVKPSTILRVAHHGSDSSSSYPFLKAASFDIAVISVGENNYGLPDETVLERLKTLCNNIYNTKTDGTVLFSTDGCILERIPYDD